MGYRLLSIIQCERRLATKIFALSKVIGSISFFVYAISHKEEPALGITLSDRASEWRAKIPLTYALFADSVKSISTILISCPLFRKGYKIAWTRDTL
jgi:hypothetical protein